MKVLQLCPRIPFPPHDGGAIAIYNITKGLCEVGHTVTVLAMNTPKHFQNEHMLNGIARLKTIYVDASVSPIKAFLNLFKLFPYNIERFISKDYERGLIELLKKEKFDVVHFEGMYVAWYVDVVKKHFKGAVILRTHNLEYLIWERLAFNERNRLKKIYLKNLSSKLKRFEKKYFPRFDGIAAISGEDSKRILQLVPKSNVKVIPAGVDVTSNQKHGHNEHTVFILSALEWRPNVEAIWWFLHNVWPDVQKINPALQLHIAGKRTPSHILKLQLHNVFVHGFVPDAREFMIKNGLMLVPLLSGSGTRIKILEGMAVGKPVLSTSLAAEGMLYINGENILVADTPDEWVKIISDYCNFPSKYEEIGRKAYEWIKENYTNEKSIERLVNFYKELMKQ